MAPFARNVIEKISIYKAYDNVNLSFHFHNDYELIYIEKGSAHFTINGKSVEYGENNVIFINNLEQHQMQTTRCPYERYVFIIEPDYFDQFVKEQALCSIFKRRPGNFFNGFALNEESAALMKEMLTFCLQEYTEKADYFEANIMSAFLRSLIHLYRNYETAFPQIPSDRLVVDIQSYMDINYLKDMSLQKIATKFHLSKYHLAHTFKETTGYTIKQYATLKRISYAKNLLCYTDKDISQVAIDSGFNSSSNFIRSFKGTVGITPLQFRKLYLGRL